MFCLAFLPGAFPGMYAVFATDYNVNWSATTVSNDTSGRTATYTLSATNPNSGGAGTCCAYLPASASVTITFPFGTNAASFTSGTYNGSAISGPSFPQAYIMTFSAPTSIAKGAVFPVVLNGITNPLIGGSYTGLSMQVSANGSGGVNIYENSGYTILESAPAVTFQKTLGNSSWSEYVGGMTRTTDGGYIVSGASNSAGGAGNWDFYLAKMDVNGTATWTQRFGGTSWDEATSVVQSNDGNYLAFGRTNSYGAATNTDFYLIKTNANGGLLWSRAYAGTTGGATLTDEGAILAKTSDGSFLLSGYTALFGTSTYADDAFLIRINSSGNVLWSKTYGLSNGYERINDMEATSDGGFAFLAQTSSSTISLGGQDFWLVKTDANGMATWHRLYGGAANDAPYSLFQTGDGGYVMAGNTASFVSGGGANDAILIKTDATGSVAWTATFGGTSEDCASSVRQTANGGYILGGSTAPIGSRNVLMIRAASTGGLSWAKTFGGGTEDYSLPIQQRDGGLVQPAPDGGYFMLANTNSYGSGFYDYYLVKTDANGTCGCNENAMSPTTAYASVSTATGAVLNGGAANTVNVYTPTVNNGPTTAIELCFIGLPVEWLRFEGRHDNGTNVLEWETASEEATDYFTVERSTDGESFKAIGTVVGSGTSSFRQYGFTDALTDNTGDFIYYRLKQVNFDASFTYSRIISVEMSNASQPALTGLVHEDNILTVTFTIPEHLNAALELYDCLGNKVMTRRAQNRQEGIHTEYIRTISLSRGMYFVKLVAGSMVTGARFIKE